MWVGLAVIGVAVAGILSVASTPAVDYPPDNYYDSTPIDVSDTPFPTEVPASTAVPAQVQPLPSFVAATFPAANPLVQVGRLHQARAEHTATLLPDGRVVFVGGVSSRGDSSSTLSSVETYDPKSRTFSVTGHLLTARAYHTTTLLDDGTLLIAGGTDGSGHVLASAEIYDPKTGLSKPTGDMQIPGFSATAVALAPVDSGVLVIGGSNDLGAVNYPEIYDPSTGQFRPLGNTNEGRGAVAAVKLTNGNVLVTGGQENHSATSATETYTGNGFISASPAIEPRDGPMACLLGDGRVLIVGGFGSEDDIKTTAETYDPNEEQGGTLFSLGAPRALGTVTSLPDGGALIVGGLDSIDGANSLGGMPVATIERYYLGAEATVPVGTMTEARSKHTATLLKDGTVLIAGGWASRTTATASAGVYSPDWTPPPI